ncbi:hypothetical protein KFK09_001205 [Dendrobium nobile]|uniref:RING-type domain-containing protein n=1 Tax=Dendrobium nobile TaxID=94219 RepID=A0A8T3C4I2_DENNO|nr:hypothetical protein KFK09_001205 [Dendrobium nobile]
MGGAFASYSFDLPKPILQLLFLLNRISLAVYLLLIFLRLRPPPPPPPSQSRSNPLPQSSDHPSSPESQPPTSSSMKNQLPVVDFARLAGDSPPAACVVCLGGFAASDEVRQLGNCRHVFHRACIDRWIDADGITCPLCRSPLLPSPEEEEEKRLIVKIFTRIRRFPLSIMNLQINLFISNLYVENYL